jgi:hypothetical protein
MTVFDGILDTLMGVIDTLVDIFNQIVAAITGVIYI